MDSGRVDISAPNLSCICIDAFEEDDCSGRIYHKYRDTPITFCSGVQLILLLNKLFDEINYPEASTEYRSFRESKADAYSRRKPEERPQPLKMPEWVIDHSGQLATFYLHVQYRQNSTWQGNAIWKEGKSRKAFRSALELLLLLCSAVGKTE